MSQRGPYTGEYNPDTMEQESKLREQLRDILMQTPDVRDQALLDEVRRLKRFHTNLKESVEARSAPAIANTLRDELLK